jgi:hypothetical protein
MVPTYNVDKANRKLGNALALARELQRRTAPLVGPGVSGETERLVGKLAYGIRRLSGHIDLTSIRRKPSRLAKAVQTVLRRIRTNIMEAETAYPIGAGRTIGSEECMQAVDGLQQVLKWAAISHVPPAVSDQSSLAAYAPPVAADAAAGP